METQRILVTGGSGFIGTNLVNELRSRGHEVLAVDLLHHEGEADLYSDSYSDYVRGDVRSYRQMERIFEDNDDFDYVYHLAAEYGRKDRICKPWAEDPKGHRCNPDCSSRTVRVFRPGSAQDGADHTSGSAGT